MNCILSTVQISEYFIQMFLNSPSSSLRPCMQVERATNAFPTSLASLTCLKKLDAFSTMRGGTVLMGLYSFLGTFFSTWKKKQKK